MKGWYGNSYKHKLVSKGIKLYDKWKIPYIKNIDIPNNIFGEKISDEQLYELIDALFESHKNTCGSDYGLDEYEFENIMSGDDLSYEQLEFYLNKKLDEINNLYQRINKQEKIFLERFLLLDNLKQLNKKKIGKHFVEDINDIDFYNLMDVEYVDEEYQDKNIFVIKIETSPESIDWIQTLIQRVWYPHENEITLKDNYKFNILSVGEFNQ